MNRRKFLAGSLVAVTVLAGYSRALGGGHHPPLVMAAAQAPPTTGNPATLPQQLIDTTFAALTGRTHGPVRTWEAFEAAYTKARENDTVLIDPNTPLTGFTEAILARKDGPIHIRPTDLTPPGRRVGPQTEGCARFIGTRPGHHGISFRPGTHDIRFINCEFAYDAALPPSETGFGGGGFVWLPYGAERIWLDRCVIHDNRRRGQMRRAILMDGAGMAVFDSYIAGIGELGHGDTQAIWGSNGPGPYKIVNNYLEAAGENIMFGGQSANVPGIGPADIEIRANHITKLWSWYRRHPSFAGHELAVKNLLELKHARRVLIAENVIENCWEHAQTGFAIVLSVGDDNGAAPWTTVSDITIINNTIRHAARGISINPWDPSHAADVMRRVYIAHNLIDDISQGYATWSAAGNFIFSPAPKPGLPVTEDQVFEHNTVVNCRVGQTFYFHDNSNPNGTRYYIRRLRISNNILPVGSNPGWGDGGYSLNTMKRLQAPDGEIRGNLFYGRGSASRDLPRDNLLVRDQSAVRFVNPAGGDYRLAADSPGKQRATDGQDIGLR